MKNRIMCQHTVRNTINLSIDERKVDPAASRSVLNYSPGGFRLDTQRESYRLALAILLEYEMPSVALRFCQQFAKEFLLFEPYKRQDFMIYLDVHQWIYLRMAGY